MILYANASWYGQSLEQQCAARGKLMKDHHRIEWVPYYQWKFVSQILMTISPNALKKSMVIGSDSQVSIVISTQHCTLNNASRKTGTISLRHHVSLYSISHK